MDAISLLIVEFTEELIFVQVGLLSFFTSCYFLIYILPKRRKHSPAWVSGAVVKNYLNEIRDREVALRQELFGEDDLAALKEPAVLKELEAVRVQLGAADSRIAEKDKTIAELRADQGGNGAEALAKAQVDWNKKEAELEKRLADALANAGASTGDGGNPELERQVRQMRARLDEYGVIEDDLANLKKYQTENKKLRERLELGGISADDISNQAANSRAAAAAEESATVVTATEELAEILGEDSEDGKDAIDGEEKKDRKSGEDILSEFEKMLAS